MPTVQQLQTQIHFKNGNTATKRICYINANLVQENNAVLTSVKFNFTDNLNCPQVGKQLASGEIAIKRSSFKPMRDFLTNVHTAGGPVMVQFEQTNNNGVLKSNEVIIDSMQLLEWYNLGNEFSH